MAASIPLGVQTSAASADVAAPARPVKQAPVPAHRGDLIVREQQYQGNSAYFVKDPLTLKYFKFAPTEYQIFQLLDGERTLEDIVATASRRFTLHKISEIQLLALVQRWQKAGLLQEPGGMATVRVLSAMERSSTGRWMKFMSSLLYMKVRAFDPDAMLNAIYPWVRWLFHPVGVFVALCSIISAAVLVASRFEEFTSQPELQSLQSFFNVQNILWLWLAVGIVKVLHEFGHGLTCKHFGGECHAMGLLFMCFTPCMYCDVSDSWMLPNKWHRIAIAAAGVYVELLVASLATFIWWNTSPGILHSLAFSAMVFGSVQTLLINANPLMRFDGYYMMSDLLEVPNLRQRSYALAQYHLKKLVWGTRTAPPGTGGFWFVAYALIASTYRVLLTAGMIWFFSRVLEPYKLASVGWVLSGMAFTNMAILPVAQGIAAAVKNPAASRPSSWWRPILTAVVLIGLLAAFFLVPLPRLSYAVLTMEPAHTALISTSSRGLIIKQYVKPGQTVRQGDPVMELANVELQLQLEKMEEHLNLLKVQSRVASAILDPGRAQALQIAIRELEPQIDALRQRIDNLVLRAPISGTVVAEPEQPAMMPSSPSSVAMLGQWNRSVMLPQNLGAVLQAGTIVCRIAESEECAAIAILSQSQVESVQVGQQAAMKLDAYPEVTFLGTVQEISVQDVEQVAPQLLNLNGSELPAISSGPRAGQLAETHYRVRIQLTGTSRGDMSAWNRQLRTGLRGRAWVRAGTHTAAEATWRKLCEVFHW
jgi:putative peptide zinc metalloprotease protein